MGTPVSRSPSPFPFDINPNPQCHFCMAYQSSSHSCPKGCILCKDCYDFYCPICLTRLQNLNLLKEVILNSPLTQPKTKFFKTITSAYYTLELLFFGGILIKITVQSATRNFRLQLKYGTNTALLHLYRDRPPYSITPFFPTPGQCLTLTPVPPNLQTPNLPGSRCAFRLYMEMFPFLLDRPEYARLKSLPSEQTLLLDMFNVPRQDERFWAIQSKCPKYDQLYFATTKKNITCFLCSRVFSSISAFADSCLGSIHTIDDIHNAAQVCMTLEEGKILVRGLNSKTDNFLSYWETKPVIVKNQPKILSAIYTVTFEPLNPNSVIKYVTTLLQDTKIPACVVYNIQTNTEQLAISALVWLSSPLTFKHDTLAHHSDLDKFHSLLFQGLYRTIVKTNPIHTHNASIFYWRDNFQACKLNNQTRCSLESRLKT